MSRRYLYGVLFLAIVLAALGGFFQNVRQVIWSGLLWGIFAASVILVVGVAGNILWAMWSTYVGYRPAPEEPEQAASVPTSTPGEVLPFAQPSRDGEPVRHATSAEDVLLELCRAERALSNLEGSLGVQGFTEKQKSRYRQALKDVHALVQEVSKESSREKVAS